MRSKAALAPRILIWFLAALLPPSAVSAAKKSKGPPSAISHLLPAGGKAGSSFACVIGGTLAKTGNRVWTDDAGIVFKPTAKPDVFDVSIAPAVRPGAHLVRFFNDEGASAPRIFVVGTYDEVADAGSNDDFRKPQQISRIPVTVNGVLEKAGDVDTYSVKIEAGRWLVCDLQGYALGSTMDPAIRLLDDRGVEVAMSHDTHNLDPFIAWEVTKTATYMVQVMAFVHPPAADVALKGSPAHVYRLTLTDQPYARAAWPCAVSRETPGKVTPLGWNFGPKFEGPETAIDGNGLLDGREMARAPSANGEPALVAIVGAPVIIEAEPNNDPLKAQPVPLPAAICGRVGAPEDEDRFLFTAKKGENLEFRVRSFALHAPTDAWLHIEDRQGKILQQDDDEKEGGFDPFLKWKAPADGEYLVAIGDLFHRGGWEFLYAIEAGPPAPRLAATIDANAYKLEAGKTVDLKVNIKTGGEFKGKLFVTAVGQPEDVTARETTVPAKGGDAKLTLTAGKEAASSNRPIEISVSTSAPDAPRTIKAEFEIAVTEPRGDRLINRDTRAWLTVVGKDGGEKVTSKGAPKSP